MNALLAVLWKDLAVEWRSRDRFAAMIVFSLLVVLVLYFAAPPSLDAALNGYVPGLLWVAYLFAGVLGMNRAFAAERSACLLADLDALEKDPAVQRVLVVTHVPILEEQLARRPRDLDWARATAYFGNLTLGASVMKRPKVATVVSGHTHEGRRARVYRRGGTPVTALVVGSDYRRPAFLTVEA